MVYVTERRLFIIVNEHANSFRFYNFWCELFIGVLRLWSRVACRVGKWYDARLCHHAPFDSLVWARVYTSLLLCGTIIYLIHIFFIVFLLIIYSNINSLNISHLQSFPWKPTFFWIVARVSGGFVPHLKCNTMHNPEIMAYHWKIAVHRRSLFSLRPMSLFGTSYRVSESKNNCEKTIVRDLVLHVI